MIEFVCVIWNSNLSLKTERNKTNVLKYFTFSSHFWRINYDPITFKFGDYKVKFDWILRFYFNFNMVLILAVLKQPKMANLETFRVFKHWNPSLITDQSTPNLPIIIIESLSCYYNYLCTFNYQICINFSSKTSWNVTRSFTLNWQNNC